MLAAPAPRSESRMLLAPPVRGAGCCCAVPEGERCTRDAAGAGGVARCEEGRGKELERAAADLELGNRREIGEMVCDEH